MANEKESLLKVNKDITKSLEKLVKGKKQLEMIFGAQRNFRNKQGVGFNPCNASSSKTVFVRASNQKFFQRKPFHKQNFSKKGIIVEIMDIQSTSAL